MLHIKDAADARRIRDPAIRRLVQRRLHQLCIESNREIHTGFFLVEADDTVDRVERETDCRIVRGYFGRARFGSPGYLPPFEALEDHGHCYELVYIFDDEGSGVLLFVPKQPDIDRELLSLCRTYAVKPLKRHRY